MLRTLVAGVGAACAVAAGAVVIAAGPAAGPSSASEDLVRFDGCTQLRDWYLKQWRPVAERPVVPQDISSEGSGADGVSPVERGLGVDAVGNGATGTNVQEADVDEADLAKTNGTVAVVVKDGALTTYDVSGTRPKRLGTMVLDEMVAANLLLVGDRAVLTSTTRPRFAIEPGPRSRTDLGPPGATDDVGDDLRSYAPELPRVRTTIATIDLSDPSEPTLIERDVVDGSVISAREHSGIVRLALRVDVVTSWRGRPEAALRRAGGQLWLPTIRRSGGKAVPLLRCSDVRRPHDPSGLGMVAVMTIDPKQPRRSSSTAVATSGSIAYTSADRMYVATPDGSWRTTATATSTHIHAFALEGSTTTYVGSGEVAGFVPDRWALSEEEGRLRVATMRGATLAPKDTMVTVLAEHGNRLVRVGSVGGMGSGERIKAVRWFGDQAVIVTFRQTDPLYTLDLSDPAHPAVAGELTLPGFSEYLHPLGDDLLLGVGQGATAGGQQTGARLSAFDVASPAKPTVVDAVALGVGAFTPVELDARAFTYLPDQRIALVPVVGAESRAGSVVLVRVATDGALTQVSTIRTAGPIESVRTLPIDATHVALVDGGAVTRIVDVAVV